jgi:alkylhydroperoxidase family enzyme
LMRGAMAKIPFPNRGDAPADLSVLLDQMPAMAPVDMLSHSPALAQHFLRLAQAQFTTLELTARNRELLILTVAAHVQCKYEYEQHIPISEDAGVSPALRESIWVGKLDTDDLDAPDGALIAFVRDILVSPSVPEATLTVIRSHFSSREIVEILHLTGFYWGFGRLCTVLDLDVETPDGLTPVNAVANLSDP